MQTQSNSKYIVGLVALVIIVALVINMGDDKESSELKTDNNITTLTENESDSVSVDVDDNLASEAEAETETEIQEAIVAEKTVGQYLDYDASAVANSEAENIVLVFTATWCPSCRALDANISKNLNNIPADTEIYKVDYDTQTELKKKYGITMQHTMVVIDKEGNMINKWSGGTTLDHLLNNLI